ncbi:hypothetical protein KDA_75800 [Dictyobacter alpinus]|uniref:Uncharacterized protein n=1 Tax=Dictyobacter alpinus TaxID=2014873 RepID=A0A402BL94_9CHLR|nr:hypothetical protein [Dictyobacter alpinus]GCE32096.1 hypothetical protein KDA_75800 [Dictyobacter alpinus]
MARPPIIPLTPGDSYRRFSLMIEHANIALLPAEHEMRVHTTSGCFSIVHRNTGHSAGEGTFSLDALPVILVLLEHWPSYVQNDKLTHALGNATESDADPHPVGEQLDRVRHLIASNRPTLQQVGLDILPIDELGYKFGRYTEPHMGHQE